MFPLPRDRLFARDYRLVANKRAAAENVNCFHGHARQPSYRAATTLSPITSRCLLSGDPRDRQGYQAAISNHQVRRCGPPMHAPIDRHELDAPANMNRSPLAALEV
jgi:hypothetical protein